MTIVHVTSGSTGITTTTAVRGTVSINVAFPSGTIAAGRLAIIMAEGRGTAWGTDPSGFTKILDVAGGDATTGTVDRGPIRIGVWYRVLTGSETSPVTVAMTSGTQVTAVMSVYSKTAAAWITPLATVSGNNSSYDTSNSVALGAWQSTLFTSDMLVIGYGTGTDATGTVTPTFTQSGITFGTITARNRWPGSDGNDGAIFSWDVPVTGGGTLTAPTMNTGWTTSNSGVYFAIRLREGATSAISTVTENFNDNSINATLWAQNYGVTSEVGGRGRIETSTTYSAFMTAYAYSLDSTGVFAHIYPAAANGATTEAYSAMWLTSGNQASGTDFGFYYEATTGVLNCTIRTAYTQDGSTVNVTYNSTDHAYWRLRLSGSNILWETSPNGSTWTQQRSAAAPAYVAATVDFALMIESHRANGTNNFLEVDNVNLASAAEVTGAAVLSGNSTLTTSGTVTTQGVFARSGTGTLVTSASVITSGVFARSAAGTLTTSGFVTTQGIWAHSGTGTLVTSAVVSRLGTAALTGNGTLTTSGAVSLNGAAVLNGVSTLTVVAGSGPAGATQLSGQLQLTTSGSVTTTGAGTLTGQLGLIAQSVVTRFGVSVLNGTGTLTVSGTRVVTASTTLTGSGILAPVESSTTTVVNVSLAGSSSLVTSGRVTTNGASALTGAGTLSTVGQNTVRALTVLIGTGSLVTSGATTVRAASALSGVGTLSTVAVMTTTGAAVLTGSGTLTAQGIIGAVPPTVTLTGTSSLIVSGQNTVRASTVQSGVSTLTVVGQNTVRAASVLNSPATLSTIALVTVRAASILIGTSALTVSGDTVIGPVAAFLSGQGSLTVAGQAIRVASTQLNGTGSMTVSATVTTRGASVQNGQGSLTVTGARGVTASATMNGSLTGSISGFIPAVVTGLAQMAAELSMEILGRTSPPWTSPYVEFSDVIITAVDPLTSRISNQQETVTRVDNTTESVSRVVSIEGG